jgi:hypothetical protein
MDPLPASRALTRSTEGPSLFATCLRRCEAAGLRLVVSAPADARAFARGLRRFPERRIDPPVHARWETAYRVFCNRSRQPHDRGSWQILVADRDDRVVGAVTARFFCGSIVRDYVHTLSLLDTTGPIFREHCEIAMEEVFVAAAKSARTAAELSHLAIAPHPHAKLIASTLSRAMGALAAAFDAPLVIVAADHRRGEVARLMRLGAAPLGRAGKFSLPPFVHHASGASLRLLLIDATTYHTRAGGSPKQDLALLRLKCPVLSTG